LTGIEELILTERFSVGYLDTSRAEIPELVERITSIESRYHASEMELTKRIQIIQKASSNSTHVIPSYSLISRPLPWRVGSWFRKLFVEEIYGRGRVMFPDSVTIAQDEEEK